MADNSAIIERIVERLKPYVENSDQPDGLELIESNLRLLDQLTDDSGAALGEMLAAVERSIEGLEQGNTEAAIEEADRWGVGHLVRGALENQKTLPKTADKPKQDKR